VIGWPLPHRSGGRTNHWPSRDRTKSPTSDPSTGVRIGALRPVGGERGAALPLAVVLAAHIGGKTGQREEG
jgi:LDH2 family malate/lactate/ureidoglycolate dehydrogenase